MSGAAHERRAREEARLDERRAPDVARLTAAKARLDALDWYPRPVSLRGVRVVRAPWLFKLPWFRRFHGYATWRVIFVRDAATDDLVTHELCHVWQMQHRPLAMPLSYLYRGYAQNPYELEARRAVALTRTAAGARTPDTPPPARADTSGTPGPPAPSGTS